MESAPECNGYHLTDGIFKSIFCTEIFILMKILLEIDSNDAVYNMVLLVLIMDWWETGKYVIFELMMDRFIFVSLLLFKSMQWIDHEARYVDSILMSEVILITIRYTHPPHHGYPQVTVMVVNDQLTSLFVPSQSALPFVK